jgi:hypothetical protein
MSSSVATSALERECAVRLSAIAEWVERRCGCFAARVLKCTQAYWQGLIASTEIAT